MAALRSCLVLSIAWIRAAESAAVTDEQSLVQKAINMHALAVAPENLNSPSQSSTITAQLVKALDSIKPIMPPQLQSAVELFENATDVQGFAMFVNWSLSFKNQTFVAKVKTSMPKIDYVLNKMAHSLVLASYHLAKEAEGANFTHSKFLLEMNAYDIAELSAVAWSDVYLIWKEVVGELPELLASPELTAVLGNVTGEDVLATAHAALKQEVKQNWPENQTELCSRAVQIADIYESARKTINEEAVAFYGNAKAAGNAAVPQIVGLDPETAAGFLSAYNFTLDAMANGSLAIGLGYHMQSEVIKEVVDKNLGCSASAA